jgi:phosphoglycerate dehydrogenase-like enzyme
MKVHLLGDAMRQRAVLAPLLPGVEIVDLPREAAQSAAFDGGIASDDVVVALRFRRPGGAPPFALLHVPGAGLDGIDFESLQQGCQVCNVFEHEVPIAEYVIHAMLGWELRPRSMSFTAESWGEAHRTRQPHGELSGKTVGIVGFGRIGRAIAERARAFGVRILALDQAPAPSALADEVIAPADLHRLLAASDYVVLAAPLTDSTHGMIDAAALAAMRPDAVLINISRAEIADEEALYRALAENRIGGAVLDVWYRYPADAADNPAPSRFPFLDLPNVVATAHSSAWSTGLPGRRYRVIAENIRRLAAGEALLNQVWPQRPTLSRNAAK